MKCLVFENNGMLDLNALRIMGASVKEGESPIGLFGTGLKYAVATAMRLGGSVEIIIDSKPHIISKRDISIRGQDFAQVVLDDEPMGFTTELGKKWEAWMVVRELLSNARDEGGQTMETERESYQPLTGGTSIILSGKIFLDVWADRHLYFLRHAQPILDCAECEFYPHTHGGKPLVFYKGIRIHQADEPMMYTYNLKGDVALTEDRTLKFQHHLRDRVSAAVATSDNESLIEGLLTVDPLAWETCLDFDIWQSPSETFNRVCSRLSRQKPKNLNAKAIAYYRKHSGDTPDLTIISPSAVQQKMIDRAINFLRDLGYGAEIDRMPLKIVEWLGENVFGQAKHDSIFLAKPIFDRGTKYITSTILEELVHNQTGFHDHTRELQTFLFDRIISMGEEMRGEPI